MTRHFIELRGIGIIDVKTLYGVECVKEKQQIDLVIKLEDWKKDADYDRLGLEEEYIEYLGNKVVCHSLQSVRGGIWRLSARLRLSTTDRRRWATMRHRNCIAESGKYDKKQ